MHSRCSIRFTASATPSGGHRASERGRSITEQQAVKVKLRHEAYFNLPDEVVLSGGDRSIEAEPDRHQLMVELNL